MRETQKLEAEAPEFPIYKFGNRWICDGPKGRFQARTKREILRLLAGTGGRYDEEHERQNVEHNLRRSGR